MAADPSRLKIVKEIGRPEVLFGVAGIPGGSRVVLAGSEFKVYDLDVAAEKVEAQPLVGAGHTSYATCVVVAGQFAISGGWDGQLIWWNLATRQQTRAVAAHQKWIRNLVVSPDGAWVVSVADDMVARRWDVATGTLLGEYRGHEPLTPHHYPSMLYAAAISPDGLYLATGDKVGHVVIWDLAENRQAVTLEAPVFYTWDPTQRRHSIGGIRSLAFSPDGRLLAVGGMDKVGNIDHLEGKARLEIFDWRHEQQTHEFSSDEYKGLVQGLRWGPGGAWLLAAGGDNGGFVIFYDLQNRNVLKQDKAPMHVHAVTLNEAGDTIYAAGHHRLVVWEMKAEPAAPTT